MLPFLNQKTAFILSLMFYMSLAAFGQGNNPDSSRISISISSGWAIPLGSFAKSSPEKIVRVYNNDPYPPYIRVENYARESSGAAIKGSFINIHFAYRLNQKWLMLAQAGFTRNAVNAQGASDFLNKFPSSSPFNSFSIRAVDYTVLTISSGLNYQLTWRRNGLNFGPMLGIGIMDYPDYEISFKESDFAPLTIRRHLGAQPNLVGLLYGGVAEIYHKWNLRQKGTYKLLARVDVGLRLSYSAADFTYYSTLGNRDTNPRIFESYKDEVNYRLLNLGLSIGYKFN
ncbi:MAG: hypothetical protein KF725_16410 [Cyclobacteriaceae bacterium]|nr:hypothetical protein [Cyclobacteriaceae bacterium]UYN87169.1 MAG: hypothetical protein KIT51_02515 [Cyclobacteriaceae bacterium]